MKKGIIVLIILLITIPLVSAADMRDSATSAPKTEIIISGDTSITQSLLSKSTTAGFVMKTAIEKEISVKEAPLEISSDIIIEKSMCDEIKCGYLVSATRNGKEVAINNPIWIINENIPYMVVVSRAYDSKINTETITVKEDVKTSIYYILVNHINSLPLGKPTTGRLE